jgi:hypothetical protein
MPVLPLRNDTTRRRDLVRNLSPMLASVSRRMCRSIGARLSIFALVQFALATAAPAQEKPIGDEIHEREELGVNAYTAPSIARIFQQLDKLRPLSFEQLRRPLPESLGRSREEKALIFGELIADGFLLVEAERKNIVDDFGRVLLREARALGVAERVTRHSASLTERGHGGDWAGARQELIATQQDVEQALIELRDQNIAHLISLGGWLRGLEICAGAVAANFSPARASVLAEPELVDYFGAELKTLPPTVAHEPLFEKIRGGVHAIQTKLNQSSGELTLADVRAIHSQAADLNTTIREAGRGS